MPKLWTDVFGMVDNGHGWTVTYDYVEGARVVYGPTDIYSCIAWAVANA